MNFENTVTEYDLDPAAVQFARELKQKSPKSENDYSIDGFHEPLSERLLRLFRLRKD